MELLWIGGALLAAAVAGVAIKGTKGRQNATSPTAGPAPRVDAPQAPRAHSAPPVPVAAQPPATVLAPELIAFRPVHADELPPERKQVLVKVFHDIPRPPRLLQHLLSPDFVGTASSAELADLIAAEPLIAARVLATVNSPLYGLRNPVGGIDQAVAYLGLTTVRSVCLQYIMIASFKADSPQRQQVLDTTWNASALASELARQLAHKLGFAEQGALVSAVVLSFLGRLATAATMPRGVLATLPARGLLARARAEQDKLGLTSGEIGRLLMREWELPANVVDDAGDIDRVLVTPAADADPNRASGLALCYLCARLGERLATGELVELAAFDLAAETSPEFTHLHGYAREPRLAALHDGLRAPELNASLLKMLQAMRAA